MHDPNIPQNTELPSKGKLIKSTILAVMIAAVILVLFVLPAEYGVDPTGIGSIVGLTSMGEIKVSLAEEAALEIDPPKETAVNEKVVETKPEQSEVLENSDRFTIELQPDEGKEIKLTITKNAEVNYLWYTDGDKANFDAHADSKTLEIKYHNYEKGKLERSEGVMVAEFDGNHGWFWRNRTSKPMTVTLEVSGNYTDVLQF